MRQKKGNDKMQYKRKIRLILIAAVALTVLSGCGTATDTIDESGAPISCLEERIDFSVAWTEVSARIEAVKQEKAQAQEEAQALEEAAKQKTLEESNVQEPVVIPQLPANGTQLSDFVPEGWKLYDSVELDFNEDKVTDYVGVLEYGERINKHLWKYLQYPRILFAVESGGDGSYQLSFQNMNLIRKSDEGGKHGDPYLPLTAENISFTTHSYGGSAWRWGEDFTYTYKAGTWYLTQSESFYGYYEYITSYKMDDWERGVGIRKERSDRWGDMEKHWDEENPEYDFIYEISLDEMPTLEQAGMRWWLAPDRRTDWEIESIVFAEGITLPEGG